MNQDKETLMVELQELTLELENMGNAFNADSKIEDWEQAILNEMMDEITNIKSEIKDLETTVAAEYKNMSGTMTVNENGEMEIKAQFEGEHTSGEISVNEKGEIEGKLGYNLEEGDEKLEAEIGFDNNGVNGKLGYENEENKQKLNAEFNTEDGTFSITGEQEYENGVVASVEISDKLIRVAGEKKWEFPDVEISTPTIVLATGLSMEVKCGISGDFKLEAYGEANLESHIAKIGLNAEANAKGSIKVEFTVLGLLVMGGELSLLPSIRAEGALCYNTKKDDFYPELSKIEAGLSVGGEIYLTIADYLADFMKELDMEDEIPYYTIIKSDEYELLVMKGPTYGSDGFSGEWSFEKGKAIKDIVSVFDKYKKYIDVVADKAKYLYDQVKAGIEIVGKTLDEAYNKTKELADAVVELAEEAYDRAKEKIGVGLEAIDDGITDIEDAMSKTYDSAMDEIFGKSTGAVFVNPVKQARIDKINEEIATLKKTLLKQYTKEAKTMKSQLKIEADSLFSTKKKSINTQSELDKLIEQIQEDMNDKFAEWQESYKEKIDTIIKQKYEDLKRTYNLD